MTLSRQADVVHMPDRKCLLFADSEKHAEKHAWQRLGMPTVCREGLGTGSSRGRKGKRPVNHRHSLQYFVHR